MSIKGEFNSQNLILAAQSIAEKMNSKYGPYWECIIFNKQATIGYSVCHAKKRVIKVEYGDLWVNLHK